MWVRVVLKSKTDAPWHIVLQSEGHGFLTMCGDHTNDVRQSHIVEVRDTEPLVEETCGWCQAKMLEVVS